MSTYVSESVVGMIKKFVYGSNAGILRFLCSATPSLLLCLCAACHARVHRLLSIWKWIPALLAELWIEQHPGAPVQMQFEEAQLGLPLEGREVGSFPGGQLG
jgi:hypothetical protein